MDEFLKRIQDERTKLEKEAEEAQRKINALTECEKIFKTVQAKPAPQAGVPSRELTAPAPQENTKHADIAEKILRERGSLTVDAIARLFEDEGKKTTTNSLRTILSREKGKRFERNKKGEWFVKKGHKET